MSSIARLGLLTLRGGKVCFKRQLQLLPQSVSAVNTQTRINQFHTSNTLNGLEEFFDKEENWTKSELISGAAWTKNLFRRKSIEDLHKIWFVLLKERNMLLTMEHFYTDNDWPMPGKDRLEKVAEAMGDLRDVLDEREEAQNMLLHGRKERVAGEWRINDLGYVYWYTYKEHLLPKEHNKEYKGDQPADIRHFDNPHFYELHLRMKERAMKNRTMYNERLNKKWKFIRMKNPHLPKIPPAWWLKKVQSPFRYGMHPTKPLIV